MVKNFWIDAKEFPTFPTSYEYYSQENAWMNEGAMFVLVEKILKPFITTTPGSIF